MAALSASDMKKLYTPDWRALLVIVIGTLLIRPLIGQIEFLGHDWMVAFSLQRYGLLPHDLINGNFYPPWLRSYLLLPFTGLDARLGLAYVNACTVVCLAVLTYRNSRLTHPEPLYFGFVSVKGIFSVLFALCNPITLALLWLGQIEFTIMLGLLLMSWGAPLLLGKYNLGMWAILSSRRNMLFAVIWIGISLVIWGPWPITMLQAILAQQSAGTIQHPHLMGWQYMHPILLLIGGVLMLFTNREPLRLIVSGMLISPYTMPYHYVLVLPLIGRVGLLGKVGLWSTTLLFVFTMGISSIETKFMAYSLPILAWLLTAPTLNPREILKDPDILINRAWRTAQEIITWLRGQRAGKDAPVPAPTA
jgi:hypothetical protein